MTSRRDHRRAILSDLDALHALLVATLALIVSGGLLYLVYMGRAWWVGRHAGITVPPGSSGNAVLVFGKRCVRGQPDADFRTRLARALRISQQDPALTLYLLGGGPEPTEAAVAARELRGMGLHPDVTVQLEDQSRDTLENLRHARDLLDGGVDVVACRPVVLISNRYHLARCALLAGNLRMPHRLCAAEDRPYPLLGMTPRLLSEAAFLMWIDLGLRWARLIGSQRMLAKLS